ncbi:hypothetical protein KNSL1_013665, partial [Colletotrichum chrysophilum]
MPEGKSSSSSSSSATSSSPESSLLMSLSSSGAPERSSLRDDPLILGRFYVQRDSVLYEDMIEWLLRDSAGPRSVCTSHRLTSDFDWPKFWEILCSDRVRYDP